MPVEYDPRPLDHLVLPVSGLDAARDRLTKLGFTVAPDGIHPFGTANCCVFFEDGTFLEPLIVADDVTAGLAAREGNVFVRHALGYRARHGAEGFSALVYGTLNAEQDDAAFRHAQVSAGGMLTFARDFVAPDGARDRAEFRLAFASTEMTPGCLFFTVERVAVPRVDRSALLRHANGVTGIAGVLMTAPAPSALAGFLEQVSGATAQTAASGIALHSGGFELRVLTPAALAEKTGLDAGLDPAPRFRAVVFSAMDTEALASRLVGSGIAHYRAPAGLVVLPEAGQGTAFIFVSTNHA